MKLRHVKEKYLACLDNRMGVLSLDGLSTEELSAIPIFNYFRCP